MQTYVLAVLPLLCLILTVKTVAQHKKEFIENHGYPGGGGVPGAILLPLQLQGLCVIGGMAYEDWEILKNSSYHYHALPMPVYDEETYCYDCGLEGESYCDDCPLPSDAKDYKHYVMAQWTRAARLVNGGDSPALAQFCSTAMPDTPLTRTEWIVELLGPDCNMASAISNNAVRDLTNTLPMSQRVPKTIPGIGVYCVDLGILGTYYVEYLQTGDQAMFKAPLKLPAINTDQAETTAINTVAEVKVEVPLTKSQRMKENQKKLSLHRRR